jgi:hypothetical protein
MVRELITFIAWQTTEELMNPRIRRLGPHGRVKHFISIAIAFTVVTIALVINTFLRIPFTAGIYISFYALIAVIYLGVHLMFKRSILARSIRLYKASKLARYAGAIGLFYMLLNLAVIVLTVILD